MNQPKDMHWWYWLVTLCLLIAGMALGGRVWLAPIGFTVVHTAHYWMRYGSPKAFPVQVRIGYLAWILLGQWDPLTFMLWIQLAGTIAAVAVGYCPLARMVSLMPWNRSEPLSLRLIWRTIVTPPVAGNIAEAVAFSAK